MEVGDITASSVTGLLGTLSPGAVTSSPSESTAEVGDGAIVGTGISVGDDGAGFPFAVAAVFGGNSSSSSSTGTSAGEVAAWTVFPIGNSVGDDGAASCRFP